MSFNGETSVPATGGAAIAIDYGVGFGAVVSAMLGAMASDAGASSASSSIKFLFDEPLPICGSGGTAIVNWALGSETATLTLADCEGSPLSGTATNGRLVLTIEEWNLDPGPTISKYTATGTAELLGLTDAEDDLFTIDPSTVLTGASAFDVEITLSSATWEPEVIDHLAFGQVPFASSDRITLVEGTGDSARTLEFGCFAASVSFTLEPPSIDFFTVQGVVNLDGSVYTVVSHDIEFSDSPSGAAAPISGRLDLFSGDTLTSGGDCFGALRPGDTSRATAHFGSDGRVLILAMAPGPECFECGVFWEDLLQVLTATAIPPCDSTSCGGTGGSGGAAGSGGTGGSGGSVAANYCAIHTLFSTDCFPEPEFGDSALLDIQGSSITYIMTVGGLPEAGPEYDFDVGATGTLEGTVATGTGDFVRGTPSDMCDAPEARLRFDIEFDESRANYGGMVNFDFTLDADCGSSICFASASVQGRLCP